MFVQYDKAKENADYWEERKNDAENELKSLLGTNETGLLGERKVDWKIVVSNKFDSKSFKSDPSDLYKQYAKSSESRRFTIK